MKLLSYRAYFILLLLGSAPAAHAVMFDLTASYVDGTVFSTTYDSLDGTGTCAGCTITSASVTLGTVLQGVVDANPNDWVLDPANLQLHNASASVFSTAPSFSISFTEADLLANNQIDLISFGTNEAFLSD